MSNEGVGHGTVPHARSGSLRALRLVAAVLVLGAGLFIGARPIGPAPALGAFLEPAHGVWSLARAAASSAAPDASVAGLGAPVEVVYDERAVPHIFARSGTTRTARSATSWRAIGCSSSTPRRSRQAAG